MVKINKWLRLPSQQSIFAFDQLLDIVSTSVILVKLLLVFGSSLALGLRQKPRDDQK